ncbi:MAG: hypothetical protein E7Z87_04880 [Cyanobacteria bacterium SIG26]|nr:hypothetical protein [Cyanobacteria bacterium SIG26]
MTIAIIEDVDNKTLELDYPVAVGESDRQYYLKPAALFNYMQDLAAKGINHYNPKYCWDELYKQGLGWFLIKFRVEFDNYPRHISQINLQTESRGCQRLNAFRDFEAFDKSTGERLFRATSSWLIVNLDDKSLVNVQQQYPDFPLFEKREDDLVMKKVRAFDTPDFEKTFHVRYDDLDINGHVNNTVYITWAMEVLDYEFRSMHVLKSMDIYFKHEVQYGEDILSQVKYDKENLVTEHVVRKLSTGEELCLIRSEYSKI